MSDESRRTGTAGAHTSDRRNRLVRARARPIDHMQLRSCPCPIYPISRVRAVRAVLDTRYALERRGQVWTPWSSLPQRSQRLLLLLPTGPTALQHLPMRHPTLFHLLVLETRLRSAQVSLSRRRREREDPFEDGPRAQHAEGRSDHRSTEAAAVSRVDRRA